MAPVRFVYSRGLLLKTDEKTGVLKLDPWLSPFQDSLKRRYAKAQEWIKLINDTEGGLEKFSRVCCSCCENRLFFLAAS